MRNKHNLDYFLFLFFTHFCLNVFAQEHQILEDGKKEIWFISAPPVNKPYTEYRNIKFKYLDEVIIDAGGCVQTGGWGDTWKRYVNPSGANSDRLYRGNINIPGITAGLSPIANYINKSNILLSPQHIIDSTKLFLTLGYTDDIYNDNGYHDHDDGTDDQCKGEGNAWVRITIIHHTPQDVPGVPHPKANLDVWWDQIDDNYLPLNPLFGKEYYKNIHPSSEECNRFPNTGDNTQFGNPPCTSQRPTVDEPTGVASVICHCNHPLDGTVHGHVNWFNVTYTGNIWFQDWQGSFYEDDDIDMLALTNNHFGVLNTNDRIPQQIGIEFKFEETIKLFNTPWWNQFKSNLNDNTVGWERIKQSIDGKPVIFTGLFGIDNQHDTRTEIHPTHFLAIKYFDSPSQEKWAFFARNWGNEGYCSQDYHGLSLSNYYFFIPNALDIESGNSVVKCSLPGQGFSYTCFSDGIVCKLSMPENIYMLWHGELTINKIKPSLDQILETKNNKLEKVPKEKEGLSFIVDTLNKRELKRWKRIYIKESNQISKTNKDFVLKDQIQIETIIEKNANVDSTISHPRRNLLITEDRNIPTVAIQKIKKNFIGDLTKNSVYNSLYKAIKKKARRKMIANILKTTN